MGRPRNSGNCTLCGVYRISLHRDHIIPKFLGGSDDESNIQLICANCHEDKTRDDLTGMPLSAAARLAQGNAQRGKPISDTRREHIRETNRVVCRTPAFREKMRQVALARLPTVQTPEERFRCNDCELVTTAGPLAMHQRAKKHHGFRSANVLF